MTDAQRLTLVRAVHTAIYLVMASASLVVLYAGIVGARGVWVWAAAGLVGVSEWRTHGRASTHPVTLWDMPWTWKPPRGWGSVRNVT